MKNTQIRRIERQANKTIQGFYIDRQLHIHSIRIGCDTDKVFYTFQFSYLNAEGIRLTKQMEVPENLLGSASVLLAYEVYSGRTDND